MQKTVIAVGLITIVMAEACIHANDSPQVSRDWRMLAIREAIREFALSHDRLPKSLEEVCPPGEQCGATPPGEGIVDVWGQTLSYERSNGEYVLRSRGPDGLYGTADDLIFSSSVENARVAATIGCYQADLGWWDEFPGSQLVLDSVSLSAGYYQVRPTPAGFYNQGAWTLTGQDSLEILWPTSELVSRLHLQATPDSLVGTANVIGHGRRKIVAYRTTCTAEK